MTALPVAFAAPLLAAAAALATAAGAPTPDGGTPSPVVVPARRTTPLGAALVLGTPVERAFLSGPYALAVAKDEEEKWAEGAVFYQQAIADWSTALRLTPSVALERAVQKAERERQRSQQLASMVPARADAATAVQRAISLERGRLYRTKLMVVRAYTGSVPLGLYARAREALMAALRMTTERGKPAQQAEVHLLLCATHAAADHREAARLALAHVPRAQREDPANALPMAICAAALDDLPLALTQLEGYVLRQGGDIRVDQFSLRDILLANDWDRLRGDRRFEALFARVARY